MKKSNVLTLALFFLALPVHCFGFTLNANSGTLQGWDTRELPINYNFSACPNSMTSDSMVSMLNAAIQLWNSIPSSSIKLVIGQFTPVTAATATGLTGNPIVLCDSAYSNSPDFSPAFATISNSGSEGRINFGVIYLNAQTSKKASIDKFDSTTVELVLAHELGHILGLGHSSETSSLMYFDLTEKKHLALSQDDMDGMAYLYPRQELLGKGVPLGCGTMKTSRRSGDSAPLESCLWIGVCLLFSFWMKRQEFPTQAGITFRIY
jgi:hypothetical protein